ncbi:hypothetical protein [Serratia aquatilis]|uniref:Uncharacterized protein n=1 Tax=Serratia aquatilis TaxID=1737515 RepID=A0ABV6EEC9_9GAMM
MDQIAAGIACAVYAALVADELMSFTNSKKIIFRRILFGDLTLFVLVGANSLLR